MCNDMWDQLVSGPTSQGEGVDSRYRVAELMASSHRWQAGVKGNESLCRRCHGCPPPLHACNWACCRCQMGPRPAAGLDLRALVWDPAIYYRMVLMLSLGTTTASAWLELCSLLYIQHNRESPGWSPLSHLFFFVLNETSNMFQTRLQIDKMDWHEVISQMFSSTSV